VRIGRPLTDQEYQIYLLEEAGIRYDHSYMHHDSQLYYVPYPSTNIETNYKVAEASEWMKPMTKMRPSSVVEVVANWHIGKYPQSLHECGSPSNRSQQHILCSLEWPFQPAPLVVRVIYVNYQYSMPHFDFSPLSVPSRSRLSSLRISSPSSLSHPSTFPQAL
jgi:hypothetical protein